MSTGLFEDEEDGYNLEEETKYKLKLGAPKSEPAFGVSNDEETLDAFADAGDDGGFGSEGEGSDKPFDDTPFDAGVEADEDTDPEKFIQQLAGKLGTSLRKYNDERGQPDFDLEKYAINSIISATHTSEMDEEDQKDIIRKIKTSGAADKNDDVDKDLNIDEPSEELDSEEEMNDDMTGEEELDEGLWDNIHAKRKRGEAPAKPGDKDYPKKDAWEKAVNSEQEIIEEDGDESNNYMFWQNLNTIKNSIEDLMSMDKSKVDELLSNGHGWALDHLATSADDIEEVYHFIDANTDSEGVEDAYYGSVESINEAEYKGKEVKLNKPMRGDVKKYKVYVKNDKGNVVKVNFGDKNMEIKRDNPERRKSFRARHKCETPGPKWKARYWSCKFWSTKSVSDLLGENLQNSENSSNFEKNNNMKDIIKTKLHEMNYSDLNVFETLPTPVKPEVKPTVEPISPRRKRIWETKPSVKPKPKMEEDSDDLTF